MQMLGNLLDPRGSGLLFFMFIRPQPYTCLGIECLKQVKLRRGTATLQWDASRLTSEASHPTVLPTAERCPIAQRFQTLTSFASLPPIAVPPMRAASTRHTPLFGPPVGVKYFWRS